MSISSYFRGTDFLLGEKFDISPDQIRKLELFFQMIIEWNKRVNLVSFDTHEELIIKHFLDSAYGMRGITSEMRVLDLGTGGGFPGIILAILRPAAQFTLLDARKKKIDILDQIAAALELKNVSCIWGRSEEVQSKFAGSFDVVTARAVAPLSILVGMSFPFLRIGGYLLAYKGPRFEEEIAELSHNVQMRNRNVQSRNSLHRKRGEKNFIVSKIESYELPNSMGSRVLIYLNKL